KVIGVEHFQRQRKEVVGMLEVAGTLRISVQPQQVVAIGAQAGNIMPVYAALERRQGKAGEISAQGIVLAQGADRPAHMVAYTVGLVLLFGQLGRQRVEYGKIGRTCG